MTPISSSGGDTNSGSGQQTMQELPPLHLLQPPHDPLLLMPYGQQQLASQQPQQLLQTHTSEEQPLEQQDFQLLLQPLSGSATEEQDTQDHSQVLQSSLLASEVPLQPPPAPNSSSSSSSSGKELCHPTDFVTPSTVSCSGNSCSRSESSSNSSSSKVPLSSLLPGGSGCNSGFLLGAGTTDSVTSTPVAAVGSSTNAAGATAGAISGEEEHQKSESPGSGAAVRANTAPPTVADTEASCAPSAAVAAFTRDLAAAVDAGGGADAAVVSGRDEAAHTGISASTCAQAGAILISAGAAACGTGTAADDGRTSNRRNHRGRRRKGGSSKNLSKRDERALLEPRMHQRQLDYPLQQKQELDEAPYVDFDATSRFPLHLPEMDAPLLANALEQAAAEATAAHRDIFVWFSTQRQFPTFQFNSRRGAFPTRMNEIATPEDAVAAAAAAGGACGDANQTVVAASCRSADKGELAGDAADIQNPAEITATADPSADGAASGDDPEFLAAASTAAVEAQKTKEVIEALPVLRILESLLYRHTLQLERHREPLLPRQKRQMLLLLLLHVIRVRPQLRPALLDPQVSAENKEKVLSLLLVEVLLVAGGQMQEQCKQIFEDAREEGSKSIAAEAAEGSKMGTRVLQLLQRLGTRGAVVLGDSSVAAAREALLQTVTHLWGQRLPQQQQQQQQQHQAAHTLLQVVTRLDSLPPHLLMPLPKQLLALRDQPPMLQHLGVQLLLAERQPPGGAAAATKSAAATDAVAAASTGAGNVQASLPSASPQPQQPVASSGPGPRVTDLKSNEQHHQPQQSGGSKNSTDGQQLKKPSRKGVGMSGWALFAKEKRLELLQNGQLTGETLPEQTSCVAKFWHALSKDGKEAWGRRAEQLNRLAAGERGKEVEKKPQQHHQQPGESPAVSATSAQATPQQSTLQKIAQKQQQRSTPVGAGGAEEASQQPAQQTPQPSQQQQQQQQLLGSIAKKSPLTGTPPRKRKRGGPGDKTGGHRGYTAFTLFARETRMNCKELGIDCGASLSEQNTFIGDRWRQLSAEEKRSFQSRARAANEAWKKQQLEQGQQQQQQQQTQQKNKQNPRPQVTPPVAVQHQQPQVQPQKQQQQRFCQAPRINRLQTPAQHQQQQGAVSPQQLQVAPAQPQHQSAQVQPQLQQQQVLQQSSQVLLQGLPPGQHQRPPQQQQQQQWLMHSTNSPTGVLRSCLPPDGTAASNALPGVCGPVVPALQQHPQQQPLLLPQHLQTHNMVSPEVGWQQPHGLQPTPPHRQESGQLQLLMQQPQQHQTATSRPLRASHSPAAAAFSAAARQLNREVELNSDIPVASPQQQPYLPSLQQQHQQLHVSISSGVPQHWSSTDAAAPSPAPPSFASVQQHGASPGRLSKTRRPHDSPASRAFAAAAARSEGHTVSDTESDAGSATEGEQRRDRELLVGAASNNEACRSGRNSSGSVMGGEPSMTEIAAAAITAADEAEAAAAAAARQIFSAASEDDDVWELQKRQHEQTMQQQQEVIAQIRQQQVRLHLEAEKGTKDSNSGSKGTEQARLRRPRALTAAKQTAARRSRVQRDCEGSSSRETSISGNNSGSSSSTERSRSSEGSSHSGESSDEEFSPTRGLHSTCKRLRKGAPATVEKHRGRGVATLKGRNNTATQRKPRTVRRNRDHRSSTPSTVATNVSEADSAVQEAGAGKKPVTLWDLVKRNLRRKTAAGAAARRSAGTGIATGTVESPVDHTEDPFALLLTPSPQQHQLKQQKQVAGLVSTTNGDGSDLQGLFEAPAGDSGVDSLRLDSDGNLVVADGPKEVFCCRCLGMSGLLGGGCMCTSGQQRRVLEEDLTSRGAFVLQPYEGAYKKTKGKRWTEEETRKFYECLSSCGTDLLLIRTMMPGVTDGQLKRKLKREEKKNAALVEAALSRKRSLSLQAYEQLHGTIRRELHCQPLNDSDEEPPPRALSALALPARAAVTAPASNGSSGLLTLFGDDSAMDAIMAPGNSGEPADLTEGLAGGTVRDTSDALDTSLMALLGGPF